MIRALHYRRVLNSAVCESHAVGGRFIRTFPPAAADLTESGAELLRHGVVDDGVDGAVEVDANSTEEQEPVVQIGLVQERVHDHQSAVRHPEQREQDDHYG